MKNLVKWLAAFAAVGLMACQAVPEAPKDAPEQPPKKAAADPALAKFAVPDGVGHIRNPAPKEIPTPTDMPDFSDAVAKKAFAKQHQEHSAAMKKACKAAPDSVVKLTSEGTRIGYVSYKNTNLPVSGLFESSFGYARFGKKPEVRFWIDPLSLESGDKVRTRKVIKLFFELEDDKNVPFTYQSNSISGALPVAEGETSKVTFKGNLTMHAKAAPMELTFAVTKKGEGYTAKLAAPVNLLKLAPFGLLAPLQALIGSCNHSAMGDAINLELELTLAKGC